MAHALLEVEIKNRKLYDAHVGLLVLSGAKRGKVDLFGTFKYHLSVIRSAVDDMIADMDTSRRELRDAHGKRDPKGNLVTAQLDDRRPNDAQVVIADPIKFEEDERQILEKIVVLRFHVPKLKLSDVMALDFGEQLGDYSGALPFIDTRDTSDQDDEPTDKRAATKDRREA